MFFKNHEYHNKRESLPSKKRWDFLNITQNPKEPAGQGGSPLVASAGSQARAGRSVAHLGQGLQRAGLLAASRSPGSNNSRHQWGPWGLEAQPGGWDVRLSLAHSSCVMLFSPTVAGLHYLQDLLAPGWPCWCSLCYWPCVWTAWLPASPGETCLCPSSPLTGSAPTSPLSSPCISSRAERSSWPCSAFSASLEFLASSSFSRCCYARTYTQNKMSSPLTWSSLWSSFSWSCSWSAPAGSTSLAEDKLLTECPSWSPSSTTPLKKSGSESQLCPVEYPLFSVLIMSEIVASAGLQRAASILKMYSLLDFPGGPEVKTLHFHCMGHRLDPWSGKFHMPHGMAKKKKRYSPLFHALNN